jgi:hypothetical protein
MKTSWASSARALAVTAAGAALLFAAGCRQDMQDQPKMIPQRERGHILARLSAVVNKGQYRGLACPGLRR